MESKVRFTKPAQDRLPQREINKETVLFVLEKPDYVKKTFGDRHIAVKKIGETRWNVVYIEQTDALKVITVYSE